MLAGWPPADCSRESGSPEGLCTTSPMRGIESDEAVPATIQWVAPIEQAMQFGWSKRFISAGSFTAARTNRPGAKSEGWLEPVEESLLRRGHDARIGGEPLAGPVCLRLGRMTGGTAMRRRGQQRLLGSRLTVGLVFSLGLAGDRALAAKPKAGTIVVKLQGFENSAGKAVALLFRSEDGFAKKESKDHGRLSGKIFEFFRNQTSSPRPSWDNNVRKSPATVASIQRASPVRGCPKLMLSQCNAMR